MLLPLGEISFTTVFSMSSLTRNESGPFTQRVQTLRSSSSINDTYRASKSHWHEFQWSRSANDRQSCADRAYAKPLSSTLFGNENQCVNEFEVDTTTTLAKYHFARALRRVSVFERTISEGPERKKTSRNDDRRWRTASRWRKQGRRKAGREPASEGGGGKRIRVSSRRW